MIRIRESADALGQPGDQTAWVRFVRLYTPLLFYWARKAGLAESIAPI